MPRQWLRYWRRLPAALSLSLQQDAALRFGTLGNGHFPAQLAARAVAFIDDVATARLAGQRF